MPFSLISQPASGQVAWALVDGSDRPVARGLTNRESLSAAFTQIGALVPALEVDGDTATHNILDGDDPSSAAAAVTALGAAANEDPSPAQEQQLAALE